MKTVWKIELDVVDEPQVHEVPVGSRVSYGWQSGNVCVWFRLDDQAAPWPVAFMVTGTGNEAPDDTWTYTGSAIVAPFVWHVWRKPYS